MNTSLVPVAKLSTLRWFVLPGTGRILRPRGRGRDGRVTCSDAAGNVLPLAPTVLVRPVVR